MTVQAVGACTAANSATYPQTDVAFAPSAASASTSTAANNNSQPVHQVDLSGASTMDLMVIVNMLQIGDIAAAVNMIASFKKG
jgi:hypothetical protein